MWRHDIGNGSYQKSIFERNVQFAMRDGRRLCGVIKKSWSMYKNVNGVDTVSIAVAMSLKDTLPPSFRNSLRLY